MDIEVFFEPVFHIVVRNMFTPEQNKAILDEAINNKKHFIGAVIGAGAIKSFRSNTVLYYDTHYIRNRYDSELLKAIDASFINPEIAEMLRSSPYPVGEFGNTNYHETQVSRYGNKGQQYKWHMDRMDNQTRILTFVYYFNKVPQKYTGGTLELTNSPIVEGKTVMKNADIKTLIPKNNMGLFFSASTAHRVLPTTSPKVFGSGRFSVNCWIGKQ